MSGKLPSTLVIITFRKGRVEAVPSVLLDVLRCALNHVHERIPSSPLFFSFQDQDLTLSKEGGVYVARAEVSLSDQSDEKLIGARVHEEFREALGVVLPGVRYRIVLAGRRS